jgi:hypothetical protein
VKRTWTWQESCKQRGPGKDFQSQLTCGGGKGRGCANSVHKRFSQPSLILIMFLFLFCWSNTPLGAAPRGRGTVDGGGGAGDPCVFRSSLLGRFFFLVCIRYGTVQHCTVALYRRDCEDRIGELALVASPGRALPAQPALPCPAKSASSPDWRITAQR